MKPKGQEVHVLQERKLGEDWEIVAVYASIEAADAFAAQLTAGDAARETRIDTFFVVPRPRS